jgi:hypothetical protein
MSTALFCVQIDYFAMNLALPRMAHDLGAGGHCRGADRQNTHTGEEPRNTSGAHPFG